MVPLIVILYALLDFCESFIQICFPILLSLGGGSMTSMSRLIRPMLKKLTESGIE